jgi:DNA-binding response OmpR family regulator
VPIRVLIVEDHVKLGRLIQGGLREEGMAVDVTGDGGDALSRARSTKYDGAADGLSFVDLPHG